MSFILILNRLFLYFFLNFVTNSSTLYKGVFHFNRASIIQNTMSFQLFLLKIHNYNFQLLNYNNYKFYNSYLSMLTGCYIRSPRLNPEERLLFSSGHSNWKNPQTGRRGRRSLQVRQSHAGSRFEPSPRSNYPGSPLKT